MYRFFYAYYVHAKHLLTPISIAFPLLSILLWYCFLLYSRMCPLQNFEPSSNLHKLPISTKEYIIFAVNLGS